MKLGEVDLPKVRHLVSSGLGSDPDPFVSETVTPWQQSKGGVPGNGDGI